MNTRKLYLVSLLLSSSFLHSCPTCVATVKNNPAPFFTHEFYEPITDESLELDSLITGSNF